MFQTGCRGPAGDTPAISETPSAHFLHSHTHNFHFHFMNAVAGTLFSHLAASPSAWSWPLNFVNGHNVKNMIHCLLMTAVTEV